MLSCGYVGLLGFALQSSSSSCLSSARTAQTTGGFYRYVHKGPTYLPNSVYFLVHLADPGKDRMQL